MKITNWKHLPWFLFVSLATIAASLLYVANFSPHSLPAGIRLPAALIQTPTEHRTVGGTPLGLAFGAISLAIFVFAALLSLRKKLPLWRVGTVQRWLRAHIWLTLLTIPLVILHSGFRLGGPMTTLLMVLYAIVMVSGIYGLFLQHRMPQLMKDQLPRETVFAEIPVIRAQFVVAAEKMRDSLKSALPAKSAKAETIPTQTARGPESHIAPASPAGAPTDDETGPVVPPPRVTEEELTADPASETALVDFMDRDILPYLQARRGVRMRLNNSRFSDDTFRFLKLRVAAAYRSRVEEMQGWCDERRLLDRQVHLQHWLHGWLFVHVPFSFLLLLLTFWHAYVTLFYY